MFRRFDAKLKLEYKNESGKKTEKTRESDEDENEMIRVRSARREEKRREMGKGATDERGATETETEEGGWHKEDLEKCQRMEREDLLLPEFFSGSKLGNI